MTAHALQQSLPAVGILSSRSPEESAAHVAAFRQGLSAIGYVDGQNVAVQYRFARGAYDRLPELASELLRLRVNVLVALGGVPPARVAKAATASTPIVFLMGDDPVRAGLVASFNRPGGNLTGVSFLTAELGGKRLGLLCELLPNARAAAFLLNPNNPRAEAHRQDVEAAALKLGRRLLVVRAMNETELTSNFAVLVREQVGGLVVENDPFFDSQRDRLVALAARHSVPAIYHIAEFPAAGGLMSYGADLAEAYHRVGMYTGRILNGEKPAELPIERPTKFELVINTKTAKALGLTIPHALRLRVEKVVQ
jgi:putative tryptophan/tyrosine transport system substrate-binding protein